jgi:hypothetical protein
MIIYVTTVTVIQFQVDGFCESHIFTKNVMQIESSMAFRLDKLSHFIYLAWSVCYEIVFSTLKTCKPGHGSAFLCELQK